MTPSDELLFLSNAELLYELDRADLANQELAHEHADEILVILLLRAAAGELTSVEAAEAVDYYEALHRRFG